MSDVTRDDIETWLKGEFANLLQMDAEAIDANRPLEDYNAISLDVVHIIAGAMRHFAIKVPRAEFAGVETIAGLADLFDHHKS